MLPKRRDISQWLCGTVSVWAGAWPPTSWERQDAKEYEASPTLDVRVITDDGSRLHSSTEVREGCEWGGGRLHRQRKWPKASLSLSHWARVASGSKVFFPHRQVDEALLSAEAEHTQD